MSFTFRGILYINRGENVSLCLNDTNDINTDNKNVQVTEKIKGENWIEESVSSRSSVDRDSVYSKTCIYSFHNRE